MSYYESVSAEVKAILQERADVVREVSIDEAYLDVSDEIAWDEAEGVGHTAEIRHRRRGGRRRERRRRSDDERREGRQRPRQARRTRRRRTREVRDFFAALPVDEVHGVGPVTAAELGDLGIETAGDLGEADPDTLADRFGERGMEIYRYARGGDEREVTPRACPRASHGSPRSSARRTTRTKTGPGALARRLRRRPGDQQGRALPDHRDQGRHATLRRQYSGALAPRGP